MSQRPQPPRRLRVFFVRHGETHENVAGVIQGQLDTPLNPFGRLQASTTANHLSSIRFDRIITSPLQRARDTAQAILSKQPNAANLQLEQDERIKERGFGVLEGKPYMGGKKKRESIEGIEQASELQERLAGFWNELVTLNVPENHEELSPSEQDRRNLKKDDEYTILLVSHGAAISALFYEVLLWGHYIQLPPDIQPSRFANCSITEVLVPVIPDRRVSSPSVTLPGDPLCKTDWTVKPPHLKLGQINDKVGSAERSMYNVLRGPDGQIVLQDLGFGKGIGYVVQMADTKHLLDMPQFTEELNPEQRQTPKVNVDELVGK